MRALKLFAVPLVDHALQLQDAPQRLFIVISNPTNERNPMHHDFPEHLHHNASDSARVEIVSARDSQGVRNILEALPAWFGDPVAIDNYVSEAADENFTSLLAREGDDTVGVALVERHFPESAELHLIAVSPTMRDGGIGRALVEQVCSDLSSAGCSYLTVHTVGPSYEDHNYAQTRAFYRRLGFMPLEEHRGLDWPGPTLILVRPLT